MTEVPVAFASPSAACATPGCGHGPADHTGREGACLSGLEIADGVANTLNQCVCDKAHFEVES